ncbi:MAG TPA: heparan-alpha-glucosaminide N-acetyltransferase domain-containing protein, partial [Bacteroidota bacterium]|nr:heparan-alpha-glucosaminide N-acetyltransferase domain-containing protein [Bacteroidota bacterium]
MVINAALPDGASALTPRDGKPGRYPFIDVLRGLAVVLMIETHTVNALLAPGGADGAFGSVLTFFNGLVAPAFLFCAGLGFAVALWRRS